MGITITIQTYNRAEELRKTLVGLSRIETRGAPEHEVLVVDNNSSDHTPAVVEELVPVFEGRLRYIHEARQGLSHARNRAVAESRHELVAFLDDDVEVDGNWLLSLATAYETSKYAAIGGRTYLVYPGARPSWLGERSEGALTKMEYGPKARPANPGELYGVNLSFRKEWLQRVGGFRTDLGRIGNCLLSSEEEDVLERVVAAGGKLLYEPSAVVGHRVAPSRLRRRWFWARSYWGKRGVARMVPDAQITCYEMLRATWHLLPAQWSVLCSFVTRGAMSEECFYQTRVFVARLGYWVGLIGRIIDSYRKAIQVSKTKVMRPLSREVPA